VRSLLHVVEAHHAHLAGYRPTSLVQRLQESERHPVVGREDRRDLIVVGELPPRVVPGAGTSPDRRRRCSVA
jgi:hypothetical protein